jgi:anti-anti-sigma factor
LDKYDSVRLEISQQQTDSKDKIFVNGEIDVSNINELDTVLNSSINKQTTEDIIVNMREVSFIGSVAIASLIGAYNSATEQGKNFSLENPSSITQRLFEITSLTGVIPVGYTDDNDHMNSVFELATYRAHNLEIANSSELPTYNGQLNTDS